MSDTDLKFFTNEPGRTLYERFNEILGNYTQYFDVLVGYFRSSGFFRMREALENVEEIRILVGLNVDKYTMKIIDRCETEIRYESIPAATGKEIIGKEVEKEFEESACTEEIEKGVRVFIDWLKSGKKLQMRAYTKAPIHAKIYIRRDIKGKTGNFGSVITGSSNFSAAGLQNNLEFNVELKDKPDVEFALEKFEELWEESVDIRDAYIEAVEGRTWLRDDITPYQIYLKTLYEFFKEEINADKENLNDEAGPEGFKPLKYQKDAVIQARKKLDAYNGVFISDVVGLGKTYICAMLANSFPKNANKLFICPPVLVEYWSSVLKSFGVANWDVMSLGKLDAVIDKNPEKYSYVFVDEAHRFRNDVTDSYTKLHQICRGKKVILISATPINNYTSDVENLIYLFQDKHNGTINGVKNIKGFFSGLESKLAKLEKGSPEYMEQLRKNSETIRDRLIREVMIRRTRSEIQQYYADDLKKQGVTFPKAGSPEKVEYVFDEETDDAFKQTIDIIGGFKYARYTPYLYLKDAKKRATMETAQKNMGGFMKTVLVKRLESSFYAFRKTLQRFIESYERFIAMYEDGKIYISQKVNVYDLLDEDTDKLMQLVETQDVTEFSTDEFNSKFIRDLQADLSQLKAMQIIWSQIKTDPKLNAFKHRLTTDSLMKGQKLIVFTESKETAEYLSENLKDIYKDRVVWYSSQSGSQLKADIEDSFNPKNKSNKNDKYDLLITTDVLAEGINLHRANVLVNYDLPWNPTRIMQRVGRINRVGTEFDRIYVYNFFPTAQSDKELPLTERILEKIQMFHKTLGGDYKYISDEEVVSPQGLFDAMNANLDGQEESTNPELEYLQVIREVRDNDPKLFELVKRLPRKAKAGKFSDKVEGTATVTFIRQGALKTFFMASDEDPKQLTFMEAIDYIKAEPEDTNVRIGGNYFDHYAKNSEAFDDMLIAEDEVSSVQPTITGNDAKSIRLLKGLRSEPCLTDDQEGRIDRVIALLQSGELPAKVTKNIMKQSAIVSDPLELYHAIMNQIPLAYFESRKLQTANVDGSKQIVLSCYLKEPRNQ